MTKVLSYLMLCALFSALLAASAEASTYEVTVCDRQHNISAPAGWSELNPTAGFHYYLGCQYGDFDVGTQPISQPIADGFKTGWQLRLPAPLTLSSIDVDYSGNSTMWSGWASQIWGQRTGQPQWLNVLSCQGERCGGSIRAQPTYGINAIGFGVGCGYTGCAAGTYASMAVRLLKLVVNDPNDPVIASASGTLTGANPVSGLASVTFEAHDPESGIQSAQLEVDGRVVAMKSFDTPGHSCHLPYTTIRPCPAMVSDSFAVDTFPMTDGTHAIRLIVRDAADGNVGILGPWSVVTSNRMVANLCPTQISPPFTVRLRPKTVSYGHGTVLSAQWPMVPWPDVEAVLLTGATQLDMSRTAIRRGPDRFAVGLTPGTNRTVRMGFRPAGSTGAFVCTPPRRFRVRAGVALRVHPKRISNWHRVHFAGRLRGGQIAAHRSVVLEARARHGRRRWTPVQVMHTDNHGHFRCAYRFTRTPRRTVFYFRVRSVRSRGFPYVAGASRARTVVVNP